MTPDRRPRYRVGALMITPGEFGSFVRTLNTAVLGLLDDMIQQGMMERADAFSAWVNGVWGPFYRDNESFFETLTGSAFASTMEEAERLRGQYLAYRADFESQGGRPSAPAPSPPVAGPSLPQVSPGGLWLGFGLAAGAGIGLLLLARWLDGRK